MSPEQKEAPRARDVLKKRYGELFDRVATVLFEADPIGINFETNTDEYEPEVGTILPRLEDASSPLDVQRIVHEEFCRWFSAEDAGPIHRYQAIAASIWEAWLAVTPPACPPAPSD